MGSLHEAYELGGVAGHGRTTVVRLGVRRGDVSPVALKQLRVEHAQDLDRRRRFIEQVRRASLLQHAHVEAVHDVVEGKDGPVAVAEWIDGRSLERLAIRRRANEEAWSVEEVALIAQALLEALRHAHHQPTAFHAQGMLHGGVWPGNVLVDVEGNVKLVDFGLASVWQDAPEPWQDLEALRYLSADHVRHGASAASDIYGVGAIVHELLAGRRFRSEHQTEAEMRAAIERIEPPERPREDLPPAVERLRRRLLEPVQNPRIALEHMLDLCATLSLGDAQESMRVLVRETLRNDSTAPEPDTPPRGTPRVEVAGPELGEGGVAKARARDSAAVHLAAGRGHGLGIELRQVPLGQAPMRARSRDTQSVPVPVDHERTAPRKPLFLQQTAPPVGEPARAAERERSGGGQGPATRAAAGEGGTATEARERADGKPTPQDQADVDTAPLSLGEVEAAVPEPVPEPDDEPEPLLELGVTAEVARAPRLAEDREPDTAALPVDPPLRSRLSAWVRGPVGWALLGALATGIGLPLVARCGADDDPPRSGPRR
jgi:serine/threonine protein kinase